MTKLAKIVAYGECNWCGRTRYLTRDHVIPRSLGGSNGRSNIVMACEDCNSLKGDMKPEHWAVVMRDIPQWWRLASKRGPRGHQLYLAMVGCGFDFRPGSNGIPYEEWWTESSVKS